MIAVSSWLLHKVIARWALAWFPPASYWCSPETFALHGAARRR